MELQCLHVHVAPGFFSHQGLRSHVEHIVYFSDILCFYLVHLIM